MDARGADVSQLRRTSLKRAWEVEELAPRVRGSWHATNLPPLDTVPDRRPEILRTAELPGGNNNNSGGSLKETASKKARFGGEGYNVFRLEDTVTSRRTSASTQPQPRAPVQEDPNLVHTQNVDSWRRPPDSGNAAENHDSTNLCRKCRRSLTLDTSAAALHGRDENCDECKRNPELAWVTQAAAAGLTQLAETLASGMSSERRGVIRGPEQRRVGSADCPPIAQFGLTQTLNWILGRIHHVNALADHLVKSLPSSDGVVDLDTKVVGNRSNQIAPGPHDADINMKRLPSSDPLRTDDTADPNSDARLFSRRRSSGTSTNPGDELPPMRLQPGYGSLVLPGFPGGQRVSTMNPPPAPNQNLNRQLPSPPGRSLPSPASLEFPSPSIRPYGTLQHINLPTPTSQHHPPTNTPTQHLPQMSNPPYLPLISSVPPPPPPPSAPSTSSDTTALLTHASTLQHEVSLQKIALSSLQSEHDKLLAAYSRSQTRAAALEKKHTVSDNEIINLAEEKLRLQTLVLELEREVEEVSRQRDHARRVAVEEGRQYLEIMRRATRLEELGKRECVASMPLPPAAASRKVPLVVDDIDTPASSSDGQQQQQQNQPDVKIEIEIASSSIPQSHPPHPCPAPPVPACDAAQRSTRTVDDLRGEITRLRMRCGDVEDALRLAREEGRAVEGLVEGLVRRVRGRGREVGEKVDALFGVGGGTREGNRNRDGEEEGAGGLGEGFR